MKIRVYTVAWNEEKILPHFLRHYARFADRIVVYDNGSNDRTRDIIFAHPQAEFRTYDTDGVLHDGAKAHVHYQPKGVVCEQR